MRILVLSDKEWKDLYRSVSYDRGVEHPLAVKIHGLKESTETAVAAIREMDWLYAEERTLS